MCDVRIKRVTSVGELASVGQATLGTALASNCTDGYSKVLRMMRSWLSFAFDGRHEQGTQRHFDKDNIVERNDHALIDVYARNDFFVVNIA